MAFYQLLVAARKQWLIDALSDALSRLDQAAIKAEATEYIPADAQNHSGESTRSRFILTLSPT